MDIFSAFQVANGVNGVASIQSELNFVLARRKEGFSLLLTLDDELVDSFDDILLTGQEDDVLVEVLRLHEQSSNDWFGEAGELPLANYPLLMQKLQSCDNVLWEDGSDLTFVEDNFQLKLKLKQTETITEGSFLLEGNTSNIAVGRESFEWITDGFVTDGSRIFAHKPVGNHFSRLKMLLSPVRLELLAQYLSIVFSSFRNIDVELAGYKRVNKQEIQAVCTLSIDEVTEDQNLIISFFESLPSVDDVMLLKKYHLTHWVSLNSLEKQFSVSPIIREDILKETKSVKGKLKRSCSKIKGASMQELPGAFLLNNEAAQVFVTQLLPEFLENYRVIGSEHLSSFRIKHVQPKLRLNISSGIQFFDGDASLEIEGEEFSLYELLNKEANRSYVVLKDGTKGLINAKYIDRLKRIFQKIKKNGEVQVSFFDLPFVEEFIEDKSNKEVFTKSQQFYREFNDHRKIRIAKSLVNAELRDYQANGIRWMLYLMKNKMGACLADDMGLGKTLQAITVLSEAYKKKKKLPPSLIVMPRSLLFNWANELNRFASHLSHYTFHGNNRDLDEAQKSNLILTTYGALRSSIKQFKEISYHFVILDESQNIKNLQSQTSKAVMLLESDHRIALSGTPIENNLSELYSLFRFLNPGMFGSFNDFQSKYLIPIQQTGDMEVSEELKKKISPYILRRLKSDVLKDLPPKVEQHIFVEMEPEQKKLYDERQAYFHKIIKGSIETEGLANSQFILLQALTELRQLASIPEAKTDFSQSSAKRELLVEQVTEAVANGHKLLIFVNFIAAMEYLSEDLEKSGIPCLKMSGQTNDREAIVDKFQYGDKHPVLLMTLKTGGVGLNLTSADMVYIFDPWWNVAAENQAIDRTHRMGQDKTVFCYRLITKNTIEDKILQLQEKKQQLFDQLLSGEQGSMKKLSEEDIDFILSEDSV